jgi:hypothetical protein
MIEIITGEQGRRYLEHAKENFVHFQASGRHVQKKNCRLPSDIAPWERVMNSESALMIR